MQKLVSSLSILTLVCLLQANASGAITLSLDKPGGNLKLGESEVFTVFLNVNGNLPDPTVPPDSSPTPMSSFTFAVDLQTPNTGAVNVTGANLAPSFSSGSATLGAGTAIFTWTGTPFTLTPQIELGSFTVTGSADGDVLIALREQSIGNNASPALGPVTADFIFENPSDPFGGDEQLFTVGPGGTLRSTGTLANLAVVAIPEPSAALLSAIALSLVALKRRRA